MQQFLCLLTLLPLAIQALPFPLSPDLWKTREIPSDFREARHPALLAVQYLNYHTGSPNHLQSLYQVKKAAVKSVPEIGNKYYVEFTTRVFKNSDDIGECSATVFFHQENPRPAINVNCTGNLSMKQAHEDDYNFYRNMKQQSTPIVAKDIPDSFGYVAPELVPLLDLAELGSNYVMWDKSTEQREYFLQQIRKVKQLIRNDDLIAFDYDVLLYETPSEEMVSCSIHIVWIPGKPPKVDYDCSHDSDENGSGSKSEEGSSSLGNFK
ncbi:ovocalyxin-32-like [Pelodytes ibericus]